MSKSSGEIKEVDEAYWDQRIKELTEEFRKDGRLPVGIVKEKVETKIVDDISWRMKANVGAI